MKAKENRKLPFWIQITAIILVGVLASVAVFFIAKDIKAEKHTVTFAYQDGTVIEKKKVKNGKGVFPPDFSTEGVFRGWSAAINNVESDIEVHPMVYDIIEDNLFYFDSPYIKEGKKFTLDINLGGKVNVLSGELIISYDKDVLEFNSADCMKGVELSETEAGELLITFSFDKAVTEKSVLSSITFKSKKVDAYSTELQLVAKDVKSVENGGEVPAVYATINNDIFFLQEVS